MGSPPGVPWRHLGPERAEHHLSARIQHNRSFRRPIAEALKASAIAVAAVVSLLALGASPARAQSSTSPPPTGATECVGCHSNPTIVGGIDENRPELYVTSDSIADSMHAGFTCISCHSTLTSTMHAELDAAKKSCAGCHEEEAALLAEGVHGDPKRGDPLTCVTCHGNHDIQDPASELFRRRMVDQCSTCHNEMGERFFGGNPFGMETHLGRADAAACWDCHGSHLVRYTNDPESPVNEANLLTTCRQCHEGATSNFADIQIHVASSPIPDDPRLRIATLYMLCMLIFVFGFFGYHTYLQITHERRRRAERQMPGGSP